MKDTPTSLAQIGESLADAFYARLLGLGLPEEAAYELPASGLSALFSLGRDIDHWQDNTMEWEHLAAQFTEGFVPENLSPPLGTTDKEEHHVPDERPGLPLRPLQLSNYPFVPGRSGSAISETRTAHLNFSNLPQNQEFNRQQHPENHRDSLPGKPLLETDMPAIHPNEGPPYEKSSYEEPRYEKPLPPPDATSDTPRMPSFHEPAETRGQRPVDRANSEPPWRQPMRPEDQPNDLSAFHREPAPSIWSRPLQGLGDFVSQYDPTAAPVPEKNVTTEQSNPPATTGSAPNLQEPAVPVALRDRPQRPLTVDEWMAEQTAIAPDPAVEIQQSVQQLTQDNFAENQPFNPIDDSFGPPAGLADTDDILNELTQRIIRDFRRYYP